MNDQDLTYRLTGPVADPDPQTVEAAFSDIRRRSRRRRHRRSGTAAAGVAAVALLAGVWASGFDQSPAENLATNGAPGTTQPGPGDPSEAEGGRVTEGVECGAVPDPADAAGIAVNAPQLDPVDTSVAPNQPEIPVSFANTSSSSAIQITTSQLEIVALDDNGAIVSRSGNGELGISTLGLEAGETGEANAFAPRWACGPTRELLAPGSYDVAVAFTAGTGEGTRLLRSPVGQVTVG